MKAFLLLSLFLITNANAGDNWTDPVTAAINEALVQKIFLEASKQIGVLMAQGITRVEAINIAHAVAKDRIALLAQGSVELVKKSGGIEMAVEGVRIGTDLVTRTSQHFPSLAMDFSSLAKDQAECLATLAKKTAELSMDNPKTTAAIVGVGATGAFLYNYVSSIDPQKAGGVVLMGYGALNLLADAKDKLKRMIGMIEAEENRILGDQPAPLTCPTTSEHCTSVSQEPSTSLNFPVGPGDRLSILYELQRNNAQSRLVFTQITN